MRALILACLFAIIASPVLAGDPNATVFPPANCSRGEQRVITWQDGTTSTYCATGQDVMKLAMPDCGADQHVVYDGSEFLCKTVASPPACGANEFLTFDGSTYACGATSVPTCAANQVLTFNGAGFICVNRTDEIPTCTENQFLTYNGASFQCASTQMLKIPSCSFGDVLTSVGGTLTCMTLTVPGMSVETEYLPFKPATQYVDCPAGTVAIACTSVVVPSGAFSCQVTPVQTNPATGQSACAQAGCSSHLAGDTSYYTTATCMKPPQMRDIVY